MALAAQEIAMQTFASASAVVDEALEPSALGSASLKLALFCNRQLVTGGDAPGSNR